MDRVSSLPDELLVNILSFLPTKEAASTSILAKRWRNLFAFVPNLAIDDSVFLYPEAGKRKREDVLQSFVDFVDRVLALQGNSPIERFAFKYTTGFDEKCVEGWICKVLQRGVSVLTLDIDLRDEYLLPRQVFVSTTLVKLKVIGVVLFDMCMHGVSLPLLKNLFLDSIGYWVDQFEMLLPACPVLETLEMDHIDWMDSIMTVSSASLKELLINSNGVFDMFNYNPVSITFDTPSLVYLCYSDLVAEDYPKVNLPNLVEARIDIKLSEDQINQARMPNIDGLEGENNVFLRFANVGKLMSGIKSVQKLFLAPNTLEVLSLCLNSMPVFKNLKMLHIKSSKNRGWQAVPVLLKNCPSLETLVLEGLLHFVTDKCGDACNCIIREELGRSLTSCRVKKIEIKGFRGTKRELVMVSHFVKSFPCLEEMRVYAEEKYPTWFEIPGVFEAVVKLMNIYNESTKCNVHFLVPPPLRKKWTAQLLL